MKQTEERAAVPVTGLVLGIETATALGGVALVSAAGILGECTLRSAESHSERILPAAQRLLATLGVALGEVAAVAVSCGPGSFTGLRTGIATAKGLAFSLRVPLYGISTLAALAANASPGEALACAVINARRGELFRRFFRIGLQGPEPLGAEAAVPIARFLEEVPAGCLLLGEAPSLLRAPGAAERLGVRLAPSQANHPRAAVIAASGLALLDLGHPTELASLRPRYLRPCDAEVSRRQPVAAICMQ